MDRINTEKCMTESAVSVFNRLVAAKPPEQAQVRFWTVCVLGGSIAGLLAARVLADHAREVVVIERDVVGVDGQSRPGVPQDLQVHVLLPGGRRWIERWLPGFTKEVLAHGATLSGPGQFRQYVDGQAQVEAGDYEVLAASRPLIESRIRAEVLARPNVRAVHAQVTGLEYRDGSVSAVRYTSGDASTTLPAGLVVDAMGRASRLSDWLVADGYDRPPLERLVIQTNYSTALFKRAPGEEQPLNVALARFSPPYPVDGLLVSAANAIENDQWIVGLMGFEENKPGGTLDEIIATCAKLPPTFSAAVAGEPITREPFHYHQGDSRRRDFTGVTRFPAGLVSVGDAVASFNPVYGQGMSSAALHASCLSEYLLGDPEPGAPATTFFELQRVIVDAAWGISAGADAEQLDIVTGAAVPAEVARRRQVMGQVRRASLTDEIVSMRFSDVAFMLAHPDTLGDPALIDRAVAVNEGK
jgi:2-polyprenyl-6-methoxyphenol hydroxylase-like FAD-dependent oxidoreductase